MVNRRGYAEGRSLRARLDFLRAAVFLWMPPLRAARSSADTAERTRPLAEESPELHARPASCTSVIDRDRKSRFRLRRRAFCRIRLTAEGCFATLPDLPVRAKSLLNAENTTTEGTGLSRHKLFRRAFSYREKAGPGPREVL